MEDYEYWGFFWGNYVVFEDFFSIEKYLEINVLVVFDFCRKFLVEIRE